MAHIVEDQKKGFLSNFCSAFGSVSIPCGEFLTIIYEKLYGKFKKIGEYVMSFIFVKKLYLNKQMLRFKKKI